MRSATRRALVATVVVCLTLVGVELVLRTMVSDLDNFVGIFEHDLADGRCLALRPGRTGTYEGWLWRVPSSEIEINERGYRDRDWTPQAAKGDLRIALIGDSMVFGLGTALSDGMPKRVEALLASASSQTVEVINAGVPGHDLPSMVTSVPDLLDAYRPQALVLLVDHNDLLEVSCDRWSLYFGAGLRRSALARLVISAMASLLVRPQASAQQRISLLERELARLAKVARTQNDEPIPVLLIESGDWATELSEAELDALFVRHGTRRASIRTTMDRLFEESDSYIIRGEGHPNGRGMALLSEALVKTLAVVDLPGSTTHVKIDSATHDAP